MCIIMCITMKKETHFTPPISFTCVYLSFICYPLSPVFTSLSFVTPFHLCLPLFHVLPPLHLCLLLFYYPLSPVFTSLSCVTPPSPVFTALLFVTPFHLCLPLFHVLPPFTCVYLSFMCYPPSPVFTALLFVTPFHLCLPLFHVLPPFTCVYLSFMCYPLSPVCTSLSCVTPLRPCDPSLPVFSNGQMLLMVDGMKGFKIHRVGMNRQPFCLCGGKSETKKFFITAQDIGKLPIYARVRQEELVCVFVCVCTPLFVDINACIFVSVCVCA